MVRRTSSRSIPSLQHIGRQRGRPVQPRQPGRQHGSHLVQRVADKCAGEALAALVVGLVGISDELAGVFGINVGQRPYEPFATGCGVVVKGLGVGAGQVVSPGSQRHNGAITPISLAHMVGRSHGASCSASMKQQPNPSAARSWTTGICPPWSSSGGTSRSSRITPGHSNARGSSLAGALHDRSLNGMRTSCHCGITS